MKKLSVFAIAIMLIIVVVTMTACGGVNDDIGDSVNPFIESIGDAAPAGIETQSIDASKVTLSSEFSEDEAVKNSAAYLFEIINYNCINTDYWVSVAFGSGTATLMDNLSGSMEVRDIYIKDGTKSYMETYGRIVKTSDNAKSFLKTMQGILDYGKMRYTADGEKIYYLGGGSKTVNDKSVKNFLTGKETIDVSKVKNKQKLLYTSAQDYNSKNDVRESIFEIDNADIQPEYIQDAKITRNDERGTYTLVMNIDPTSEALEMGRSSLRKSASSKDLDYGYQQIEIEIWDNGLMRAYKTKNSWHATILFLSGASENTYERYFGYDKSKAKILTIPDESKMSWLSGCK